MIDIIILHGSSAVGKTYMMKRILAEDSSISGWEIDDCKYWLDDAPTLSRSDLQFFAPPPGDADFDELMRIYMQGTPRGMRSVAFFVSKIREMLSSDPTSQTQRRTVIATVGALPPPPDPGRPSVYAWLAQRLPVSFCHVLIEIPEDRHLEQMKRRGRLHLRDEILENNVRRLARRDQHDVVISDLDELRAVMRDRGWNGPAKPAPGQDRKGPPMKLRTHRNTKKDLKYVQIFGERNSGTNYLKRLVSENMNEPENVLGSYATKSNPNNLAKLFGYKHYYADPKKVTREEQAETLFLVLYKNPYTWIRSTLSKPYHFQACLEGRSITDLAELRLEGFNVRGLQIPDVHPETGELVNIFELRRHKIRNWEGLIDQVDNVVYLNYELLLLYPTEIVQSICDDFGSLFATKTVTQREPDMKYVEKYVEPEPFTDAELAVMDANIDWQTESLIGYQKGNFFIPL